MRDQNESLVTETNKENGIQWNEKNLLKLFDLIRIYGTARLDKITEIFGSTRKKNTKCSYKPTG